MSTRHQHFVNFLSPGTFFHEETAQPIEAWDTAMAVSMAKGITERHGAKPFAFQFSTSIVGDPVDDGEGGKLKVEPKQIKQSGLHFIGGTVLSIEDVRARDDKGNGILLSNMEINDIALVCENRNSYRSTNAFGENDVVVNPDTGDIIERGNTPERMAMRKQVVKAHKARLASMK